MEQESNATWVEGAIGAVKAITFICDVITYPVYLLLQRPWEKRRQSSKPKGKIISADQKAITVRTLATPQESHTLLVKNEIDTMEKVLRYAVKKYPDKKCLGTREILAEEDEEQPDGRIFKKYKMGDYIWTSFSETDVIAANFGKGLVALGQERYKNIVIFGETRAQWLIAAQACFKQNFPVVTIYATLGEDAIAHGINETEVSFVITTHDLLPKFKNILKFTPKVKTIIYMEDQLSETDTTGLREDVNVIAFKEVIKKGESLKIENSPPKSTDTAIIMYTSGSTGVPKGVILTHENIVSTLKGFSDAVPIKSNDIYLAYLPLAHVYELLSEYMCLFSGVPIGYSTPLTMVDTSSKIMRGTKGDASVLRPTIITAVPLILDRIYKGINDKLNHGPAVKKSLFYFAYNYKKKWVRKGFSTPLIDSVIFSQVKQALGGRVRIIVSGGAPLSPDTHEFIKTCLCNTVVQGYGLTETCAAATAMDLDDMTMGRAGSPLTVCDIRLTDWDEGNYRVCDKPYPRGEIIIGGNNVSPGYYKLDDKTKEDFFTEDGCRWFKTGDIGEYHPDGVIKIIDRKKDLVKLQAGEYVSLGKVETQLKTCPVVENICVYGDARKDYTVALIVPNPVTLKEIGEKYGFDKETSIDQLCEDSRVEREVLHQVVMHGKKCKLQKFEIPAAIKLCKEVWSPDMGLVTAAFKLKRKEIQERYQHEINRMYAS
ncbi:fatty acid CoA ligase Acsl3 [Planococcus citri]|uniref:fatty acid CoA ligase Acsl3 n=1 Tax=Planococcus citri TaxID=170843 RepID=UPI0031F7DEEC